MPSGVYEYIRKRSPIHQVLRAENVSRHRTHTATRPVWTGDLWSGDAKLASRYVREAGPVKPGETWCFSIGIFVSGQGTYWSPATCIKEPGEIEEPVDVPNVTGTVTTVYQYDDEGNKTGQTSYVGCLPGDEGCEGRITVYADRLIAYQWDSSAAAAIRRGATSVAVWTYDENGKFIGRTEYTGCVPASGDELDCAGEKFTPLTPKDLDNGGGSSPPEDNGSSPPEDDNTPPVDEPEKPNSKRECTAAAWEVGHPDHEYCNNPQ